MQQMGGQPLDDQHTFLLGQVTTTSLIWLLESLQQAILHQQCKTPLNMQLLPWLHSTLLGLKQGNRDEQKAFCPPILTL